MKIALILLALALPAFAADSPSATLIKDIEGSYAQRLDAGKPGQKFQSEDMVELVRHDDRHLYVHAALTTPAGQRCNIAGVAGYENGAFIYRDPNPPLSGDQCTLTISVAAGTLRLSDRRSPKEPSTCRALCTGGAILGEYAIPLASKVKTGNPARHKASREYIKAIKAFEEAQK